MIGKIVLLACLCVPFNVLAWDGYDWDEGNFVEIEPGNLVRPDETIEYYDYGKGEYREGRVEDISDSGSEIEVTITDQDGEKRTLSMDNYETRKWKNEIELP